MDPWGLNGVLQTENLLSGFSHRDFVLPLLLAISTVSAAGQEALGF